MNVPFILAALAAIWAAGTLITSRSFHRKLTVDGAGITDDERVAVALLAALWFLTLPALSVSAAYARATSE